MSVIQAIFVYCLFLFCLRCWFLDVQRHERNPKPWSISCESCVKTFVISFNFLTILQVNRVCDFFLFSFWMFFFSCRSALNCLKIYDANAIFSLLMHRQSALFSNCFLIMSATNSTKMRIWNFHRRNSSKMELNNNAQKILSLLSNVHRSTSKTKKARTCLCLS